MYQCPKCQWEMICSGSWDVGDEDAIITIYVCPNCNSEFTEYIPIEEGDEDADE